MLQLPPSARLYLFSCYVLGALALGWCLFTFQGPITLEQWLLAAGLGVIGAVCQVLVVIRRSTTGIRSDHLTLAPLFAALLLIPRPLLALVIIATFVPEWYLHRRKWFGQLFNIAVYLIACVSARLLLFSLTGEYRIDETSKLFSQATLGVLAIIPVFEVTQAFLLAVVFKLAAGQSFRQTGLFEPRSLLLEVGLICMGVGFATSYVINPFYGIVASLPLVLIFDALHVPNLKEEASTDSKTGLANMRHFNAVISRDLERAERSGEPLSLLVCDLDYLRNINNTYGHQAGDTVLVGISNIIKRHIRGGDVAARFGGEEFVILLSDTNMDDARVVAERLRQELEAARFDVGNPEGPVSATMSIGVATYPRDGRTHEMLMHEADLAVYQAKREGRNRVVCAGRESRELAGEWAREHLVPASAPTLAEPAPSTPARPLWSFINEATRFSLNQQSEPASAASTVVSTPPADEGTRNRQRRKPDASPGTLVFIGLTVLLGLLGLVPGFPLGLVAWAALGFFTAVTVLIEQLAVRNTKAGNISVSVVTILGATFLWGETAILVMAVAAAISMAVKNHSPLHRAFFNFGMMLVAAQTANWTFKLLAGTPIVPAELPNLIIPAVAAGLVYYIINQTLLCIVRGIHEKQAPWQIWLSEYRWLWPHYGVLGLLGLVVALAQLVFGWLGVLAMMAPVAMMHLAFKQYMENTTVYVNELRDMNGRLTDSYEATLQALTRALDTRDEETEEHSQRVKRYTFLIAERMDVPSVELEDIARGALLHDIGKIGVPDAILLKPGKLTHEERDVMRKHPEIGYRMIAHIPFLARAAQVVLHHHEAYDGSGYPSGLVGANIPLGARIFAVADTYDAMTSDRPYRRALSPEDAFAEIDRCKGTQFDPEVVEAFLSIPVEELVASACLATGGGIGEDLMRSLPRPAVLAA